MVANAPIGSKKGEDSQKGKGHERDKHKRENQERDFNKAIW